MKYLPKFALAVVLLDSSRALTATAETPRGSGSDASKVQQVLLAEFQEGATNLDRRGLLSPQLESASTSDLVHWQAGYLKAGGKWQPAEQLAGDSSPSNLVDYRRQRNAAPKTAEGQLKLANWCRSQKLVDQERAHLSEMLTLSDPEIDRTPIYRRMGYRPLGGQWVSSAEYASAQTQVRQLQASLKEWAPKLERIARDWDAAPKPQQQAKEKLNAIHEVAAIPAMLAASSISRPLALAVCDQLKEIDSFESSQALATIAVQSDWASVRDSATEALRGRRLEDFVPTLLAAMRSPFLVTKHNNNPISPRLIFREEADRYLAIDLSLVPVVAHVSVIPIMRGGPVILPTDKRFSNDLLRDVSAIDHDVHQRVDEENEFAEDYNARAASILSSLCGQEQTSDPRFWWAWWHLYTGTVPVPKKCEVVHKQVPLPFDIVVYLRRCSCLVAGTPIQTDRGLIAVETIEVGDRVLSKDVETGELAYKPVLHTTERPAAPVKKLLIEGESIVASNGHHFWVSGKGWVKASELTAGVPVHTVTGTSRLKALESQPEPASVYNLVVADFHTYFVGPSLILSHDVLQPALTNTKVPGLQQAVASDD
ncbi:MAG: hypothetical protein JWP89_5357 [Schlesneria sp.]|nr:hypothetical protein [Schlesneria sp.]